MKLSNKRLAHRITSTDSFGIFGPNRVTSHAVQFFAHLFSRRDHHSDHGTKVSLRLANNCFYHNVSFRSSFTNASAFLSASKHPTNADCSCVYIIRAQIGQAVLCPAWTYESQCDLHSHHAPPLAVTIRPSSHYTRAGAG